MKTTNLILFAFLGVLAAGCNSRTGTDNTYSGTNPAGSYSTNGYSSTNSYGTNTYAGTNAYGSTNMMTNGYSSTNGMMTNAYTPTNAYNHGTVSNTDDAALMSDIANGHDHGNVNPPASSGGGAPGSSSGSGSVGADQ